MGDVRLNFTGCPTFVTESDGASFNVWIGAWVKTDSRAVNGLLIKLSARL